MWREGNLYDAAALKYGFKDRNQVIATQLKMKNAGLYNGSIDGNWGDQSRKAYELYKKSGNNKYGRIRLISTQKKLQPVKLKEDEESMGFADDIMNAMGVENGWARAGANVLGTAAYFLPGVGSALSAYDAYKAFSQGHYARGLANMAFMIPGLSSFKAMGKTAKGVMALPGLKQARAVYRPIANFAGKGVNKIHAASPRFSKAINSANEAMGWKTHAGLLGASFID